MKVIQNKIIPFGRRYHAVNLFGVLFAKGPCSERVMNHEKIHSSQMREMLYIGFYLWYCVEWVIRVFLYGDSYRAYRNISFEREAYANEGNPSYLSRRKSFSSMRYLKSHGS